MMHTIVVRRELLRERPGPAHEVFGLFSAVRESATVCAIGSLERAIRPQSFFSSSASITRMPLGPRR